MQISDQLIIWQRVSVTSHQPDELLKVRMGLLCEAFFSLKKKWEPPTMMLDSGSSSCAQLVEYKWPKSGWIYDGDLKTVTVALTHVRTGTVRKHFNVCDGCVLQRATLDCSGRRMETFFGEPWRDGLQVTVCFPKALLWIATNQDVSDHSSLLTSLFSLWGKPDLLIVWFKSVILHQIIIIIILMLAFCKSYATSFVL